MPYFETANEWLDQSTLLLQARPSTTRITTKYTIPNSSKPASQSKDDSLDENRSTPNTNIKGDSTVTASVATLTLKTYDPASGVTLKYRTNKAAEVGRLIQIMGRLGRGMAGLEMKDQEPIGSEAVDKKDTHTPMQSAKKNKKKSRR